MHDTHDHYTPNTGQTTSCLMAPELVLFCGGNLVPVSDYPLLHGGAINILLQTHNNLFPSVAPPSPTLSAAGNANQDRTMPNLRTVLRPPLQDQARLWSGHRRVKEEEEVRLPT